MKHCARLINIIWKHECIPSEWCKAVIFPLYKDGDNRDPNNYRQISLQCVVSKVYATVLHYRLREWSDDTCEDSGRTRWI